VGESNLVDIGGKPATALERSLRNKPLLLVLAIALAVLGGALPAAAGDRPENGRISFGRFDPALGDFSIWAANPDGTHQQRLTHVPSFFSDWSPDGHRIAFDFADDTGVHIATMDPNGRHVRQLTFGQGIQEVPKWSPDGRWITFNIAPEVPNAAVMAVHPSGSGLRVIRRSNNRFELFKPVWSPDGRKFLVGCFDVQAQIDKLCVMTANGRNVHVVVATPDPVNFPAWGSHPPKR
jgi:dipeptidyl aminopeptidase/acylaminoacyl peptidase